MFNHIDIYISCTAGGGLGPPIKVWGLGFGPNQGLRSGVWALPEPEVWGLAAAQGTPPRPGCTYLQHRVVYWQDW